MHVNVVNADPTIYNASESSGTGAGIPRNMTGLASKMKEAGYRTHMVGKVRCCQRTSSTFAHYSLT
jgi:arylsulfatase I/J